MKKVYILVDKLKIRLTAENEREVKAMLFDICEGDEEVELIVGKSKEKIKLNEIFSE